MARERQASSLVLCLTLVCICFGSGWFFGATKSVSLQSKYNKTLQKKYNKVILERNVYRDMFSEKFLELFRTEADLDLLRKDLAALRSERPAGIRISLDKAQKKKYKLLEKKLPSIGFLIHDFKSSLSSIFSGRHSDRYMAWALRLIAASATELEIIQKELGKASDRDRKNK